MVELAVRAANAGNAQMWRFVAVDDLVTQVAMRQAVDEAIDEMAAWPELAGKGKEIKALRAYSTFFVDAPLVMAVFGLPYLTRADEMLLARGLGVEERDRLRARPDLQSIGAAVQLLCTAAYALGYGSCWMTAPVLAAPAIESGSRSLRSWSPSCPSAGLRARSAQRRAVLSPRCSSFAEALPAGAPRCSLALVDDA
jgi:nitroreductase